jgi:hypothetical protein
MERFVAEQNILHFRRLLGDKLTPDERTALEQLLAEEEAKLRALRAPAENSK